MGLVGIFFFRYNIDNFNTFKYAYYMLKNNITTEHRSYT